MRNCCRGRQWMLSSSRAPSAACRTHFVHPPCLILFAVFYAANCTSCHQGKQQHFHRCAHFPMHSTRPGSPLSTSARAGNLSMPQLQLRCRSADTTIALRRRAPCSIGANSSTFFPLQNLFSLQARERPCTCFVNPPHHLPFVEDQVCRSPS